MTLKNRVSDNKSDADEEKREHGEIDCCDDYGADGHVLDAICGTSVRDGKALQGWV